MILSKAHCNCAAGREDCEMKKKRYRKAAASIAAVLCLAAVFWIWGERKEQAKAAVLSEESEIPSTKQAVLELERGDGSMVPVGNREKMNRLEILKNGETVFAIKKRPSENQENFMEWYVTEPFESPQLVNVSDLYSFLDHYASWDCMGSGKEEEFSESGIIVEEEFSDTGVVRIHVGKKEEGKSGRILIESGDSRKFYEMEEERLTAMTTLNPEDFIMGIANLVYLTTVENLEVETQKGSVSFEIETDKNNGQVYRAGGKVLDGDAFRELYGKIVSIVTDGTAEKKEKEKEPVLTLRFQRNTDGLKDVEIRYFPYDAENYLIEKDGTAEFLADRKQVDDLIKNLNEYCRKR